jgi:hypothetical protein
MATTDGAGDADETTETTLQTPVEDARDELQLAVPEAADTLRDLLDAEDERVQLRAAEAVLDRAGLTKADGWSNLKAQVQVGGGEREGQGLAMTDPLEDGDGDDFPL